MTIDELERLQDASRIGLANWEIELEAPCGRVGRRVLLWSVAAILLLAVAMAF